MKKEKEIVSEANYSDSELTNVYVDDSYYVMKKDSLNQHDST
jgi:hypothetical protein